MIFRFVLLERWRSSRDITVSIHLGHRRICDRRVFGQNSRVGICSVFTGLILNQSSWNHLSLVSSGLILGLGGLILFLNKIWLIKVINRHSHISA